MRASRNKTSNKTLQRNSLQHTPNTELNTHRRRSDTVQAAQEKHSINKSSHTHKPGQHTTTHEDTTQHMTSNDMQQQHTTKQDMPDTKTTWQVARQVRGAGRERNEACHTYRRKPDMYLYIFFQVQVQACIRSRVGSVGGFLLNWLGVVVRFSKKILRYFSTWGFGGGYLSMPCC